MDLIAGLFVQDGRDRLRPRERGLGDRLPHLINYPAGMNHVTKRVPSYSRLELKLSSLHRILRFLTPYMSAQNILQPGDLSAPVVSPLRGHAYQQPLELSKR